MLWYGKVDIITIPSLNLCHLANTLPSGEQTGAGAGPQHPNLSAAIECIMKYFTDLFLEPGSQGYYTLNTALNSLNTEHLLTHVSDFDWKDERHESVRMTVVAEYLLVLAQFVISNKHVSLSLSLSGADTGQGCTFNIYNEISSLSLQRPNSSSLFSLSAKLSCQYSCRIEAKP